MSTRARPTAATTTPAVALARQSDATAAAAGKTTEAADDGTRPESANLDIDGGTNDEPRDPEMTKVPRARHEIITGPGEDDKIAPGTMITGKVADEHGLDDQAGKRLLASGAIELVDVLRG